MKIAGLPHAVWREIVQRGAFPEAPVATDGGVRAFDPDDLICLVLFRELMAMGITRIFAANIASDIRTVLRESPELDRVSVVKGADDKGKPRPVVVLAPAPGALVLLTFSIGTMRASVTADLAGVP